LPDYIARLIDDLQVYSLFDNGLIVYVGNASGNDSAFYEFDINIVDVLAAGQQNWLARTIEAGRRRAVCIRHRGRDD